MVWCRKSVECMDERVMGGMGVRMKEERSEFGGLRVQSLASGT